MDASPCRSCIFIFITYLFCFNVQAENPPFDVAEIKSRLEGMNCIIKPRYTPAVENHIKKYLAYNGRLIKSVMERAAIYFPIFDQYLENHELPLDLKYLAVLESSLYPKAVSPAGAAGLWQFMAETGRNYGLVINKEVDERSCPYHSTEAAMKYLARQYEHFGNWELALAAYNTGSGKINNAIKRARTKDYWELCKHLPRETANFVPAFLGAAYAVNYYSLHDIELELPNLDFQLTEAVKVYNRMDFSTIARVAQLPLLVVEFLNPAFKKDFVPENPEGHYVILPRRTAPALIEYAQSLRPDQGQRAVVPELPSLLPAEDYTPEKYYFRSVYTVAEGDNIHELARIFNCSAYNLRIWNQLSTYHLTKGQELEIWFPNEQHRLIKPEAVAVIQEITHSERQAIIAPDAVPTRTIQPLVAEKQVLSSRLHKPKRPAPPQPGFIYYQLNRNESLLDITYKFPGVTVRNLLEWNKNYSLENPPLPGASILVKVNPEITSLPGRI